MSFGVFFSTLNPTLMTYSFNTTNTYKTMHEVITYSLMQSQKSNLQIYFKKFIKTISNPLSIQWLHQNILHLVHQTIS